MLKQMKLQNKKNPSNSLKNRYQNNLGFMNGSNFVFDCAHLLHYKYHKINPNCDASNIDSSDWITNKKTTINSMNKKDY